jgi:hypothetical protein
MKICVCGWYYLKPLYDLLAQVNDKYPVHVIAHRHDDILDKSRLSYTLEPNKGLEWGAYATYLRDIWDGESDVLFMHDDVRIRGVVQDYSLVDPIKVFDTIARFGYDQAYIFKTKKEDIDNYGIHGRAFFCSARFLHYLREHGGFYADMDNTGHTNGPTPVHCKHFNEADYKFAGFLKGMNGNSGDMVVNQKVILPAFDCARRGKFAEQHGQI